MFKWNDSMGLDQKKCKPCEGIGTTLKTAEAKDLLGQLDEWKIEKKSIKKTFKFKNFYETIAFVNAVAWICNQEDHHPDLIVGYSECSLTFSTHALGGLTENDFICAKKIDNIFK